MAYIIKANQVRYADKEEVSAVLPRDIEAELQEAYEQGVRHGIEQTKQQIVDKNHQTDTLLESIMTSIPQQVSTLRGELSQDLAQMACSIIEHILLRQPPDQQLIAKHVNAMLAQIDNRQQLTLFLHPDDLDCIKNSGKRLDVNQFKQVQVSADSGLARGECRIKTNEGVFEHSIDQRITSLTQWLKQLYQGVVNVSA